MEQSCGQTVTELTGQQKAEGRWSAHLRFRVVHRGMSLVGLRIGGVLHPGHAQVVLIHLKGVQSGGSPDSPVREGREDVPVSLGCRRPQGAPGMPVCLCVWHTQQALNSDCC